MAFLFVLNFLDDLTGRHNLNVEICWGEFYNEQKIVYSDLQRSHRTFNSTGSTRNAPYGWSVRLLDQCLYLQIFYVFLIGMN